VYKNWDTKTNKSIDFLYEKCVLKHLVSVVTLLLSSFFALSSNQSKCSAWSAIMNKSQYDEPPLPPITALNQNQNQREMSIIEYTGISL